MVRSVVGKVMWVGRATVFLMGLAVILALLLGIASMALGADGKPFILGKKNTANKVSKLVKSGVGPALNLQVGSGPPLAVNSSDTVNNLSSDLLDGKDASEFAAYKRTVVVSPVGTDTENGQALLDAMAGIMDASATKNYLLHIEAGTYDLDSGTLSMKPFVDIQGAGELRTIITSTIGGCASVSPSGTVRGANNSELRLLTVENTGTTGGCNIAIYNSNASPRITQVTAESIGQGGSRHIGVYNEQRSSPTLTNVTVTAEESSEPIGVWNDDSSPTIKNSRLSGVYSLRQTLGGTAKVALTQLVGEFHISGGSLECFNNYNEDMAPKSCTP